MTITLTVAGRIATVDATTHVVAGNTYPVTLALDSEWTGNLYLRVRFGSLYYDIPFASSAASVDVQMPVGYPEVGIGVYSEALEICTCEARVRLLRSILEAGEQVVEFDSDLYDQWAGEVTTLLTDDAFDAESTRPVQNAVLTAWKDTVPLDSALVHRTGNESILGQKTFLGSPIVQSSTPTTNLVSTLAHDASSNKAILTVYDQKDGANSAQSQIVFKTASGYEQIAIRASTPNRQSNYELVNRAFSDHQLVMVTAPYYPVDGSSNPQALTANALVASGNIAVDPRLVHTTGNESIAGNKTFLANIAITGTVPIYKTESTLDFTQGATKGVYSMRAKNGSGQTVDYATASLLHTASGAGERMEMAVKVFSPSYAIQPTVSIRAMADGTSRVLVPSHLPTGSGGTHLAPDNTEAINSEMLAVDPRIVHTTGNESVAGTKTFSGTVETNNLRIMPVVNGSLTGWRRIYTISPASDPGNVFFLGYPMTGLGRPTEMTLYLAGNGDSMQWEVGNNTFGVQCVSARNRATGVVEIWATKRITWNVPMFYRHVVSKGDLASLTEPPAVGDTYDIVATL